MQQSGPGLPWVSQYPTYCDEKERGGPDSNPSTLGVIYVKSYSSITTVAKQNFGCIR